MLMCVLGAIIPPMVILSLISVFYDAFRSNYYIAALLKECPPEWAQSSFPWYMTWAKTW